MRCDSSQTNSWTEWCMNVDSNPRSTHTHIQDIMIAIVPYRSGDSQLTRQLRPPISSSNANRSTNTNGHTEVSEVHHIGVLLKLVPTKLILLFFFNCFRTSQRVELFGLMSKGLHCITLNELFNVDKLKLSYLINNNIVVLYVHYNFRD